MRLLLLIQRINSSSKASSSEGAFFVQPSAIKANGRVSSLRSWGFVGSNPTSATVFAPMAQLVDASSLSLVKV